MLHVLKTATGATWALRQMRVLRAAGLEVHVALPPGGPMVGHYERAGIVVHPLQASLPVRKPWAWPDLFARVRDLVKTVDPDLVHSHFVGTTVTLRMALGRSHPLPRIFQVPGPLHLEHAFFRTGELGSSGGADHWIGSCRWTADRYRAAGIPEDRVHLAYYGIDLDHFVSSDPDRLRREVPFRPDQHLVGMVAYFYAPRAYLLQRRGLKGHEDFIDALALLMSRRDDIRGVVVGGPWNGAHAYADRVRRYAEDRCGDRIAFLGYRSDIADLYPGLSLAVHPSLSENVGGAVESMALGVPTIATRVGGFPDLVHDGETGWLVPPAAPRELARVIGAVLDDPARTAAVARAGRDRARAMFDVQRTAGDVLEIYGRILGLEQRLGVTRPSRAVLGG